MAKKMKKQLTFGKKLLYVFLSLALVAVVIYAAYYLIHYRLYDEYKQFLSSYEYETGTELELGSVRLKEAQDYRLVCQSDVLELYLNPETTDVAIRDKRSGQVTFAVPPEADEDEVANKTNKNYLKSHIIVTYFNAARAEGTYDSWSMSVEREQFTLEAIENGVRVIYDMGDYSNSMSIPMYMSEEKFAEISALLSEEDAKSFNRYYSTTSDVAGMRQLLKTMRSNKGTQAKIAAMLESVGFTEEDYVEQMTLAGSDASVPVSFQIPLEYRLEGDHLEVSVPVSAIGENGGASVYRIQVLRSFAAAGTDEEGYMVVPNGDGSIINFNNGKSQAANYSQYIYGIDPLSADYNLVENSSNATMGLFAICRKDATVLATVEDGASLALITAGVSGKVNSYNYVYPTFVVRGSEKLEMFGTTGNEASLPLVEPVAYDCNLTVRYSFLDAEHTGYSGVANYYRERLINEGVLTPDDSDQGNIPFYYDVISGVEMTEYFLGKQYMGLTAMTTFGEAQEMARILDEKGISNQVMNLQGWFNDGYYHDVANSVWINWKLGGKSGLEALNETLTQLGGTLYGDVAFQKVSYEAEGLRYNYEAENAKYYSGYTVSFGQVNPATMRQTSSLGYPETCYNLVSPKFLVRYVEGFAEEVQDLDLAGISLRDLGSVLLSDKKRTEPITREEALDIVVAQLALLDGTGKNMMVNSANDYTWAVADDILNLPLGDNEYAIVDEDIPLYEMIVHGSIDYCGSVYNLENVSDDRLQVLNMIEYGAAPHFVFTWEETSEMKYSGLNNFYSTTFTTWVDTAAQVYSEVNSALSRVSGAQVVDHQILGTGIRKITYSNGVTIYVNYSKKAVSVDGIQIPAMGYEIR